MIQISIQKVAVLADASSKLPGTEVQKTGGSNDQRKVSSQHSPSSGSLKLPVTLAQESEALFWPQWTFSYSHIHIPQIK